MSKFNGLVAQLVAAIFMLLLVTGVAVKRLPANLLYAYAAMSAITYFAYARDKSSAQANKRRIPNASLHFLSFLCGWPGAFIAQQVCRHKNRQFGFLIITWVMASANVATIYNMARALKIYIPRIW